MDATAKITGERGASASGGLRVAVDGRSLAGSGPGRGVAHYLRALLAAWPAVAPQDELRVVVPGGAAALPRASGDGRIRVVPVRPPGRAVWSAAAAVGRPRLDRLAGGCDVAWIVAPAPVAVSDDVPTVLTVHDRSWELRPGDFTPYERLWHATARPRRLAARATRVLTTTQVGRDDLLDAWSLAETRVAAVPLAPVVVASAVTARTASAGVPYRLFVGALEPRKGPDVLAGALGRMPDPGRTVVVGSGRLDGLLRAPGVVAAGPVDDAALSALYAGAERLVVPSRLEGFGLPALEALAHGTPVVATDLPEVREVLGDAAGYVPADDPAALAAALQAPVVAPGHPPVRTWLDVARETRAALAEAAG